MKKLKLKFDATQPTHRSLCDWDAEAALELAVSLGYEAMEIDWARMFRVELPTEDDLVFLVEAAQQLRSDALLSRHEVFLGDGLFQVETDLAEGVAKMRVIYTPHLDKRFSEEASKILSCEAYVSAWNNLIRQFWSQLKQHVRK